MTRALALLACLLGCVPVAAHEGHEHEQRVNRVSSTWPVDAFTLTDQHGKSFTQDRLNGRWTFVLFGDTQCKATCTEALAALDGLYRRINRARVVETTQVIFVSLDPQHDDPSRIRAYLAPFDNRFVGGTASPPTLARLVDDWSVAANESSRPEIGDTRSKYSGALLLVGPDGSLRAEYLPPFDVPRLTADYLKTRIGARRP